MNGWEPLPEDARVALADHATAASERVPLRVSFCSYTSGSVVRVFTKITGREKPNHDFLIVRGASGLRCAVEGNVEGEPCDLDDYDCPISLDDSNTSLSSTERIFGASGGLLRRIDCETPLPTADADTSAAFDDLVYLVRKTTEAGSPDLPGVYESIASYRLIDSETASCSVTPVIPELSDEVKRIMEPSPQHCKSGRVTCAGPDFAHRIPLENELTTDDGGRGIENSWRYWLSLAEESANHADQLGEMLLTAGEVLDEKAEQVENTIRDLCGVEVNAADAMFDLLDEEPGGYCNLPATPCPTGYRCEGDLCVRDIEAYLQERAAEDLNGPWDALLECIGGSSNIELVAAGTKPMCLWKLEGDDDYCGDAMGATKPCPFFADGTNQNPTCPAPTAIGLSMMDDMSVPTATLGIFVPTIPTEDPPAENAPPFDCNRIRAVRRTNDPAAAVALLGDPFFRLDNIPIDPSDPHGVWIALGADDLGLELN